MKLTDSMYENALKHDDRLCGIAVRVPGYRYRGPRFDFLRYQIF
jgi:hypothetical protein